MQEVVVEVELELQLYLKLKFKYLSCGWWLVDSNGNNRNIWECLSTYLKWSEKIILGKKLSEVATKTKKKKEYDLRPVYFKKLECVSVHKNYSEVQ